MAEFGSALVNWPILEVALAIVYNLIVRRAWRGVQPPLSLECVEERSLGATVILSQLSGVITGSSIIIAGIGAFVALSADNAKLVMASSHAFYAAADAVFALGLAVWTIGILPTLARRVNFVRSRTVALFSATALFFVIAAGVRFIFAVSAFLFA